MNLDLYKYYDGLGGTTILIALAIILMLGFILSRVTKLLKLPNVTAYIIAGVIIGPYILGLIPNSIIENMSFLSDLALGFIAFGVGKFFKKEVLKTTGFKVIIITILEALIAGVLVTLICGIFFKSLGWPFALLLGAIATATAPASTMMTINEYKAKGEFVNILLQVVALDDVVCLLVFSISCALVSGMENGSFNIMSILLPILYNISFIIIGVILGFILPKLIKGRSNNSKLILVIGIICIVSGICSFLDISPLLSCMCFGASYINLSKDEMIFKQTEEFAAPIMLLFFVMSGMNMNLQSFKLIGVVGFVYFLVRIIGKYLGAYLGCKVTKINKKTTNYLGLALIPQAGVAIGLAFLGKRLLPSEVGDTFLSVILCSSILYEMLGPIMAKIALFKSGAIKKEEKIKDKDIGEEETKLIVNLVRNK